MADKFIGDYMENLPKVGKEELKAGNGLLIRTAQGMKELKGEELGPSVFAATYGTTTYAQISEAIEAGQAVVCVSRGNVYQLDGTVTATGYTFTRSWQNENGKVYTSFAKVDSANAWTNKNVEVAKASDVPTIDTLPEMEGAIDPTKFVGIGAHVYPIVKIGNLYWLAQNLREEIGTLGTDFFKYSDATIETYGYYYKWDSLFVADNEPTEELSSLLPEGWRVPTSEDRTALYAVAGTAQRPSLIAVEEGGTNTTGFTGYYGAWKNGSIWAKDYNNPFWMSWCSDTAAGTGGAKNVVGASATAVPSGAFLKEYNDCPVRFCCDASIIEGDGNGDGKKGLVPQPLKDDANKVLEGSGNWVRRVSSDDVFNIVKVTAMPENPDPNTLYLVVEEPTTASEVE